MIVYAHFTSAFCYLASLRVDRLTATHDTPVDWRAIEHRPGLVRPGLQLSSTAQVIRGRELTAARSLLTHREQFPARNPRFLPNVNAANTAYATARAKGLGERARRVLFDALTGYRGCTSAGVEVLQRLLPEAIDCNGPMISTSDGHSEWLALGTCIDLTLVSVHRVACGRSALDQLIECPLRVAYVEPPGPTWESDPIAAGPLGSHFAHEE